MNGIRIELEIGGEREKVFFATRRAGEDGEEMRRAQRLYHDNQLSSVRLATRIGVMVGRADAAEQTLEALTQADTAIGDLAVQMRDASDQARNCAERFVRLSLLENYGEADVERFLRNLTDVQIAQLVGVVETGSVPADFFPSRATPPSASTISPPGAGPGASSSNADSPAPTSPPAT
jgi:hypothetical protein